MMKKADIKLYLRDTLHVFQTRKIAVDESGKYYLLPIAPAFVSSFFWTVLQSASTMFSFQRT